jgi:hypothetical protein
VLAGYRHRYREWPIDVHMSPISFDVLQFCYDGPAWSALTSQLKLIRLPESTDRVLMATDGHEKRYDYWIDGVDTSDPGPDPEEWLGVSPSNA